MYTLRLLLVLAAAAEEQTSLGSRSAAGENPNPPGYWKGIFHKRRYGNAKVKVQTHRITSDSVRALAFDPSDTYLFAGGAEDNKVKMWDVSWITQGKRDKEPATTTTTTTAWELKSMRQQLRAIRLNKIKGSLHPDYIPDFNGQLEANVQVPPGVDSPKKELPPYKITCPLIGEFDVGFRVNAMVITPSQPESTYTLRKNGLMIAGGENGDVVGYDIEALVRELGVDHVMEQLQEESATGGEPNPDSNNAEESLLEKAQAQKAKKTFSPQPVFTLKQGVKVDQLVLSNDAKMLCGCGTYLSMVDRIFESAEAPPDAPGSTNASEPGASAASGVFSRSLAEHHVQPDKGENETFKMPINASGAYKHEAYDPRNGWASCWDVSRFTSGNLSQAAQEGAPERIFRAKRGDETFACALADADASLITGGDDQKVRKYSIHTEKLLKEYNTTATVTSLAVNEKTPTIVYAGLLDGEFVALDMPLDDARFGAKKLFNVSHGEVVDKIMFYNVNNADHVLTAGWYQEEDEAVQGERKEYALPVADEDMDKEAELNKPEPPGDNSGRIEAWSVGNPSAPQELSFMSVSGMSWVNTMTMTKNKDFMVSGQNDGSIVFWNPAEFSLGRLAARAKYKQGKWSEAGRADIMGPEKRFSEEPILPKVDPNTPEVNKNTLRLKRDQLARVSLGSTPPDVLAAKESKTSIA